MSNSPDSLSCTETPITSTEQDNAKAEDTITDVVPSHLQSGTISLNVSLECYQLLSLDQQRQFSQILAKCHVSAVPTQLTSILKPRTIDGKDFLVRDVRRMIFGLLLLRPTLGKYSGSRVSYNHRAFDLSPSILGVCKVFHQEASAVLYESNTFVVDCTVDQYYLRYASNFCPITRYHYTFREPFRAINCLDEIPILRRVVRWKVIASIEYVVHPNEDYDDWQPKESLVNFCQLLSTSLPHSVMPIVSFEIVIEAEAGHMEYKNSNDDIGPFLAPLRLLRNIQEVYFTHGPFLPASHQASSAPPSAQTCTELFHGDTFGQLELVSSMTSNTPAELAHEIYRNLLRYAQSFERCEQYRDQIGLETGPGDHNFSLDNRVVACSPFLYLDHPVEYGVHSARLAYRSNDVLAVKKHRADILNFMEPQYKRIVSAAYSIPCFITKNMNGMFDPTRGDSVYFQTDQIACLLHLPFSKSTQIPFRET